MTSDLLLFYQYTYVAAAAHPYCIVNCICSGVIIFCFPRIPAVSPHSGYLVAATICYPWILDTLFQRSVFSTMMIHSMNFIPANDNISHALSLLLLLPFCPAAYHHLTCRPLPQLLFLILRTKTKPERCGKPLQVTTWTTEETEPEMMTGRRTPTLSTTCLSRSRDGVLKRFRVPEERPER